MPIDIQKLVDYINRKFWWHVTPVDTLAYQKRGKFFSSTYPRAEFYGRPNDEPEKVSIRAPLVGDANTVEIRLLGKVEGFDGMGVKHRLALDARMKRIALRKGYDSIVVLAIPGYKKFRKEGNIPRSIELNVVDLRCLKYPAKPNGTL
jgi:hypothetical protein